VPATTLALLFTVAAPRLRVSVGWRAFFALLATGIVLVVAWALYALSNQGVFADVGTQALAFATVVWTWTLHVLAFLLLAAMLILRLLLYLILAIYTGMRVLVSTGILLSLEVIGFIVRFGIKYAVENHVIGYTVFIKAVIRTIINVVRKSGETPAQIAHTAAIEGGLDAGQEILLEVFLGIIQASLLWRFPIRVLLTLIRESVKLTPEQVREKIHQAIVSLLGKSVAGAAAEEALVRLITVAVERHILL
jgi:hypothetical protein